MKDFKGFQQAELNPMWKGDDVGYEQLHTWVRIRLPKPDLCQTCKNIPPYDLANITGNYNRQLTNWNWLCRRCHMLSDGRMRNLYHPKLDTSDRKCNICNTQTTWKTKTGFRWTRHPITKLWLCSRCYTRTLDNIKGSIPREGNISSRRCAKCGSPTTRLRKQGWTTWKRNPFDKKEWLCHSCYNKQNYHTTRGSKRYEPKIRFEARFQSAAEIGGQK